MRSLLLAVAFAFRRGPLVERLEAMPWMDDLDDDSCVLNTANSSLAHANVEVAP